MAESNHIRGEKKGQFCACAVSGGKCECGKSFQDNGKPKWGGKPQKPSQAHHLLPVTCVTSTLMSQYGIQGVLRGTKWCINDTDNMYGMPTWAGTVRYYCIIKLTGAWSARMSMKAPGFENIPQHLVGHSDYNTEVAGHLQGSIEAWSAQDHKVKAKDIRGELDGWSKFMYDELVRRGIRNGGTHACWMGAAGNNGVHPGWYEPFSMSDTPEEQAFPLRVSSAAESFGKWLKKVRS